MRWSADDTAPGVGSVGQEYGRRRTDCNFGGGWSPCELMTTSEEPVP